jgi:hypothetical protein
VDRKKGGPPSPQPPSGCNAEEENVSREDAKVIIFQKFRPDPSFLDYGGLTPLWIFPIDALDFIQSSVKPEHSRTPSLPQNVLGNYGTLSPTFRAFASSRETFFHRVNTLELWD